VHGAHGALQSLDVVAGAAPGVHTEPWCEAGPHAVFTAILQEICIVVGGSLRKGGYGVEARLRA
jgi:hypothetical protein